MCYASFLFCIFFENFLMKLRKFFDIASLVISKIFALPNIINVKDWV